MTDVVQDPEVDKAAGDGINIETGDGTGGETPQTPVEAMFSQAQVDAIVRDRLDRAQKQADKRAADAAAEAERKAAEEQGRYQDLYQKAQADLDAIAKQMRQMELSQMRAQVAAKFSLPDAIASRLQGETAEDMEADAKTLAAALPKPSAPNITSSSGSGAPPRPGAPTDEELREKAVRYGLKPSTLIEVFKS